MGKLEENKARERDGEREIPKIKMHNIMWYLVFDLGREKGY